MASPSNGSQPSTPSAEHNPWTFGSVMNAADFGECFDYDMFIRNAILVAELVENGDSGYIESYTYQEIQGGLLVRVVGNGRSEYLDFRSTEFSALSLFEDVISNAILDGEVTGLREQGNLESLKKKYELTPFVRG
ncbi:hypothetical protein D6C76_08197 [Aureobasidium pullulans]|nr:hypothetical protein D6C76_08197 [Aureobasidium pullulans]